MKIAKVKSFIQQNRVAYTSKFQQFFPFTTTSSEQQNASLPQLNTFRVADSKSIVHYFQEMFSYQQGGSDAETRKADILRCIQEEIELRKDDVFTFDAVIDIFLQRVVVDDRISVNLQDDLTVRDEEHLIPEKSGLKKTNQFGLLEQQQVQLSNELQEFKNKQFYEAQLTNINQEQYLQKPKSIKFDQKNVQLRLKNIYDFYCRLTQNVGQNATFQRYAKQYQRLNLSKIVQFVSAYNLISDKVNSSDIREIYKMVGMHQQQINFVQFKEILKNIAKLEFGKKEVREKDIKKKKIMQNKINQIEKRKLSKQQKQKILKKSQQQQREQEHQNNESTLRENKIRLKSKSHISKISQIDKFDLEVAIDDQQYDRQCLAQLYRKMAVIHQGAYREKLKSLHIPVMANKMVPLDKEHHDRMLEAILAKRKLQAKDPFQDQTAQLKKQKLQALKERMKEKQKNKEKDKNKQKEKDKDKDKDKDKSNKYDSKKANEPASLEQILFISDDDDDDYYMREYLGVGVKRGSKNIKSKLKKGKEIVQQIKRRAKQQSKVQAK